jgi:hypothetical protein
MVTDYALLGREYCQDSSRWFNVGYGTLSRGSLEPDYSRKWKAHLVLGNYILGVLTDQQKEAEVIAGVLQPVMDYQLSRPRHSKKKDALFEEAYELHAVWSYQWLTQGIADAALLQRANKSHADFVRLQYGSRVKKSETYGISLGSALLFIGGEYDLLMDLYRASVGDPAALEVGKARNEWQHTILAIRTHVHKTLPEDAVLSKIGRFLDSQIKYWFEHGHYLTILHWLYIFHVILQGQTNVPPLDVVRKAWHHLGVAMSKSKKKSPDTLQ